jgi:Leucine-rich repeat (LRR) protein
MEIERMDGLKLVPKVTHVYLQHNSIKVIPSLALYQLTFLTLAYNEIEKMESLEDLVNLKLLDLEGNKITTLNSLPIGLEYLVMRGNPMETKIDYRLSVIKKAPKLIELDEKLISKSERTVALHLSGYFDFIRLESLEDSASDSSESSTDTESEDEQDNEFLKHDVAEIYLEGIAKIVERSKKRQEEMISYSTKYAHEIQVALSNRLDLLK